jgi:hypothetical protein
MFGVSMQWGCDGAFPGKEDGMEVFAGIAPLSQTVLKNPWPSAGKKNLTKVSSVYSLQLKNMLNYF